DSYGNKTKIVDSSNRTNGLAYDGRGKPLTITDPLGTQVVNGFDDSGNLTNAAVVDALGNPVQNSTSQFENGHLVGTKNGSQVTGTYYYDATGNPTNSIDANGVSRKLRYVASGNQR